MNAPPARYWRQLDDERIQCLLCPRACRLRPGKRGFCFVRQNVDGQMVLTTYGCSSGFAVDPIEKKPLYHVAPGSAVLSFGTAGCNLGCKFCQNWRISTARKMDALCDQASPEDIAASALVLSCQGLAYTYNDPVIFAEYAIDVAEACHEQGLLNLAVTAGYVSEAARVDFFAPMDAANVDLKAFSDEFYRQQTGGRLQPVLDTLTYLVNETSVWVEITTLLIPGLNDSDEELHALTEWVADQLGPDVPLHFTAFHPAGRVLDRPPTAPGTLRRARAIGQQAGLRYVYIGNVDDAAGSATYCPNCEAVVASRKRLSLDRCRLLDQGLCPKCDTLIPGLWAGQPAQPFRGMHQVSLRLPPTALPARSASQGH
ncbi:MAG: AmmeMemoRadiSam system radical SAM enzyme [Micrococcales bacterium]|nr:AmmeMemoRadiSam system radical SAM enzyme [Micrococcales bacterium]